MRREEEETKGKGRGGIGKKMGQLASKLCGSVRICVGSEALEVHVDTKVPSKSGERARSGVAAPHEDKVEDIEFTGKANISLGVKVIRPSLPSGSLYLYLYLYKKLTNVVYIIFVGVVVGTFLS